MFNMSEVLVDSLQNGKKQVINKYITNQDIKQACMFYVDAQTKFLHTSLQTSTTVMNTISREVMNTKVERFFNPLKIDWFKAGWDAWTAQSIKQS